jgi:hypothetical protein
MPNLSAGVDRHLQTGRLFDRHFAVNLGIHASGIGVVFLLVNRGVLIFARGFARGKRRDSGGGDWIRIFG